MTAVMELLHGIDSDDDDVLIEVQVLRNGRLVSDCAEHTDDVEVVRQLRFALEQIEVRGNVEMRESILGRRHLRLRNGLTIDASETGYWGERSWQVLLTVVGLWAISSAMTAWLFG